MSIELYLGSRLKYPITITKLTKKVGDEVVRGEPVFQYSFSWVKEVGDPLGETWNETQTTPADWDSSADGTITKWRIREGMVIESDMVCADIEESCAHSVQFGGMCAHCGKDMTQTSYAAEGTDADRARINMIHDQTHLTVSRDEAAKAEEELQRRLLKSRKLTLVVDLDMTIIHACIEPTVGEWQRDPNNPNYEAVKDVKAFQLSEDGPRGLATGYWYYIKMRPGLKEFLARVSELYELHVYTMGTRAYAVNIAKLVDPDKRLFGDRIISRDENGSMTAKSLSRLFPVDTKMVVIIDDRADVWPKNRPNLIKVVPYDFFVGIGDINSSFLPKREEIPKPTVVTQPMIKEPKPAGTNSLNADNSLKSNDESPFVGSKEDTVAAIQNSSEAPKAAVEARVSALEELVKMGSGDDQILLRLQSEQREESLEKQVKERPLLQLQQQLEKEDTDSTEEEPNGDGDDAARRGGEMNGGEHSQQRHNLLNDDDQELIFLQQHLAGLHKAFYDDYDRALAGAQGGRLAQLRPGANKKLAIKDKTADLKIVPDIADVLPRLKSRALESTVLVLSGLVPLNGDVMRAEISQQAISFGARIETRVSSKVTHVVASSSRTRTAKVRQAATYSHIKIVNSQWLVDSMSQWERLDENNYLVEVPWDDRMAEANPPANDDSGEDASESDDGVDSKASGDVEDPEGVMPEQGGASPIDDLRTFDWEDADKELNEFLASGDEDDSDSEGSSSTASRQSTVSPEKRDKRKHAAVDSDDDDAGNESGSNLAKKQKLARIRSTGLKTAKTAGSAASESSLPTPDGTGGEEGEGEGEGGVGADSNVNVDVDVDEVDEVDQIATQAGDEGDVVDDDDDGLEAEMMAEFERAIVEDGIGEGEG